MRWLALLLLPALAEAAPPSLKMIGIALPTRQPDREVLAERAGRLAEILDGPAGRTPAQWERLDLGPQLGRACTLYRQGAIDEAAKLFDMAVEAGARAPHRLLDPADWVSALVTRALLGLSRGERALAAALIERLLRHDPRFDLTENEHTPKMQTVLNEVKQRLGAVPALRSEDLGESCQEFETVIVLRGLEGGAVEVSRFDRCHLSGQVAVDATTSDQEILRELSSAATNLPASPPASPSPAPLPSDPATIAKAHFEAGRGLYHLGRYREAIAEFEAGHALVPRPEFLINLGQAYRRLGELGRAREHFARFLAEAPLAHPERGEVQRLVADMDRALAPLAPLPTVTGERPLTASPAAHDRRGWRRPVLWIGVSVAVLAVAGAAVGIGFAAARDPTPSLGTLGLAPP